MGKQNNARQIQRQRPNKEDTYLERFRQAQSAEEIRQVKIEAFKAGLTVETVHRLRDAAIASD